MCGVSLLAAADGVSGWASWQPLLQTLLGGVLATVGGVLGGMLVAGYSARQQKASAVADAKSFLYDLVSALAGKLLPAAKSSYEKNDWQKPVMDDIVEAVCLYKNNRTGLFLQLPIDIRRDASVLMKDVELTADIWYRSAEKVEHDLLSSEELVRAVMKEFAVNEWIDERLDGNITDAKSLNERLGG